jgi:putative ABC transport system substrate-binding protein
MSLQAPDLVGKRMELLREIAPRARSVAIMANASNRGAARESIEAKSLASALGFMPEVLDVRSAVDLWRALDGIERRVDALFVCRDALINSHEARIVELTSLRLPAMQNNREAVTKGALIAYGPNLAALFRRSAEIVDKILRGAKPADIPVEQPTRFELAINMKTARALGIEVPPMLLARADEVIE